MKIKNLLVLSFSVLLVSCAHTPTAGEKMLAVSDHAKALSGQWDEGNSLKTNGVAMQKKGRSMVSDGESMVAKGNKMIAQGNSMLREGEAQVASGSELMQKSESKFAEKYADTSKS